MVKFSWPYPVEKGQNSNNPSLSSKFYMGSYLFVEKTAKNSFDFLPGWKILYLEQKIYNIVINNKLQVMYFFKLILLSLSLLRDINSQASLGPNLLCNFDFESYSTDFYNNYGLYSYNYGTHSNDSCWTAKNQILSNFYILRLPEYGVNNKILKLYYHNRYLLCRNLTLSGNQTYQYSFDMGLHRYTINATASVYINSVVIKNFTKSNSSYPNWTQCIGSFIPTNPNIQFCIGSSENNTYNPTHDDVATYIDNVYVQVKISINSTNGITLNGSTTNQINLTNNINTSRVNISNNLNTTINNISNNLDNATYANNSSNISLSVITINASCETNPVQDFQIIFNVFIDDVNNKISFTSQKVVDQIILDFLNSNIIVKIDNQAITNYNFFIGDLGYLYGELAIVKSFQMKNLAFNLDSKMLYNNICLNFQILLVSRQAIAYYVDQNQKAIISIGQQLSKNVVTIMLKTTSFIQIIFSSYYMSNFITFFSLTILYNYLNLVTQPAFSYESLNQMVKMFFENDMDVLSILGKIFMRNITDQSLYYFVDKEKEKVPLKQQNFDWFHSVGITYNFILNSYKNLFCLGLLLIKTFLICLLRLVIYFFNGNRIFRLSRLPIVFVVEFLCNSMPMSISALQCLKRGGVEKFMEKINMSLHIIMLWVVCLLPGFYILTSNFFFVKTIKIKKRIGNSTSKKTYRKFFFNTAFRFLYYLLYLFLPCLVVFRKYQAFFALITLIVLSMFILLIKGFSSFTIYNKIYRILVLFNLFVHHTCFFIIFCLSTISAQLQIKYSLLGKICGIIVIWTVFIGAVLQMIDSGKQLVCSMIFFVLKLVRRVWCEQKNIEKSSKRQKRSKGEKRGQKAQILIPVVIIKKDLVKLGQIKKTVVNKTNKNSKNCIKENKTVRRQNSKFKR